MSTDRIRTYPYKVVYIDLRNHRINHPHVLVFANIVKAKNSDDAKSILSASVGREISIISSSRHPENKGNIAGSYYLTISAQRLDEIKKEVWVAGALKSRKPVTSVDSNPKYTVPLNVGGFTVGSVESSNPPPLVQEAPSSVTKPDSIDDFPANAILEAAEAALTECLGPEVEDGTWRETTTILKPPIEAPSVLATSQDTNIDREQKILAVNIDAMNPAQADEIMKQANHDKVLFNALFFDTNLQEFPVTGCPPPREQRVWKTPACLFGVIAFLAAVYGVVKVCQR